MKKTAIIVGVGGQDGRIAYEYLSGQDYALVGLDRDTVRTKDIVWETPVDITDSQSVAALIREVRPTEVYYLAAFHQSSQDVALPESELFMRSYQINLFSYLNFLEAIRENSPETRIFYAASSLIFGEAETEEQTEQTAFRPNNAYGITKLDGLLVSRLYREKYRVFAAVGILYNHESEYRSSKFISMKIVEAAVNIQAGRESELIVGDLSSTVDWGYARDYVEAMHRILSLDKADEYIVATGEKHTVQDFVETAFGAVGLDWKQYVREDASLLTRKRQPMIGSAAKLRAATDWRPMVSFEEMVQKMVEAKKTASL